MQNLEGSFSVEKALGKCWGALGEVFGVRLGSVGKCLRCVWEAFGKRLSKIVLFFFERM